MDREYELARRAREGDREALERLVGVLRVPLFSLAYAQLRHYDDAQDAVAAALLRICMHIHHLKEPRRVHAWMKRIVRNEAHRLLQCRGPQAAAWGEARAVAAQSFPSELRLDIEQALERLPKEQARTVALFYLAGLPIREIARRLGRAEGTIKFWLHQGRHGLAREMEEYRPMTPKGYRPMTPRWIASIVSTEIDPDLLARMGDALKAAGWDTVQFISDFEALGRLTRTGTADNRELHLPTPLAGSRCLVLDEWIGGRSAFELLPLLSAAAERKNVQVLLLTDDPREHPAREITIHAAYATGGVDMLLTKPLPFDLAEFESFCKRMRTSLAEQ